MSEIEPMGTVYNPWPNEKFAEVGGQTWVFPHGEREVPLAVAEFVAGAPGAPGGTMGGIGLRRLTPELSPEQRSAVKYDGIRAAVIHDRRFGRGVVTEEMEAIADGVLAGSLEAIISPPPAKHRPPPAPAHLPNPGPGETYDPAKHRPQNRGDSFAGEAGAHRRMVGIQPGAGSNLGEVSTDTEPPPPPPPPETLAPEPPVDVEKKTKGKKKGG